jgi:hypothetical protein
MARRTQCSEAGYVYHVLNRAVGRAILFRKSADYAAFEEILPHETDVPWLSKWPMAIPPKWGAIVNRPQREAELLALRRIVLRGAPYGDPRWQKQTAAVLGLQSALRRPGRPRKNKNPT